MSASFCRECGKKLQKVAGNLAFREITPAGFSAPVRVHVTCAKNHGKTAPHYAQAKLRSDIHKYLGDKP